MVVAILKELGTDVLAAGMGIWLWFRMEKTFCEVMKGAPLGLED